MAIAGLSKSGIVELGLLLIATGALSGFLAGLFGIGGGAVLVPVFYECFRLAGVPLEVRMPLCVGTSLAVIIPTSISSFRAHYLRGAVDMDVLKVWWLPIVIGVVAGSAIARVRRSGCSNTSSFASPSRPPSGSCSGATAGSSATRCRRGR